jgi:hypothetical protein
LFALAGEGENAAQRRSNQPVLARARLGGMGNFRNALRILRATATEVGRAHLLAVFERVDLSRLEVDQAVGYGIRGARMRLRDDHEKIERVEDLRRLLPAMFGIAVVKGTRSLALWR